MQHVNAIKTAGEKQSLARISISFLCLALEVYTAIGRSRCKWRRLGQRTEILLAQTLYTGVHRIDALAR